MVSGVEFDEEFESGVNFVNFSDLHGFRTVSGIEFVYTSYKLILGLRVYVHSSILFYSFNLCYVFPRNFSSQYHCV